MSMLPITRRYVIMSAHVDNGEEPSSACEGLGDEDDVLGLAVNGTIFSLLVSDYYPVCRDYHTSPMDPIGFFWLVNRDP